MFLFLLILSIIYAALFTLGTYALIKSNRCDELTFFGVRMGLGSYAYIIWYLVK